MLSYGHTSKATELFIHNRNIDCNYPFYLILNVQPLKFVFRCRDQQQITTGLGSIGTVLIYLPIGWAKLTYSNDAALEKLYYL